MTLDRHTWNNQVLVPEPIKLLAGLRAARLPLATSLDATADGESESEQSKLVCIADVRQNLIHAIVVTPSGWVFRFEPTEFEPAFWLFAARNYFWVTGSLADRRHVAQLSGVPFEGISGRALQRNKTVELSALTLDALLAELGCAPAPRQGALF